MRFAYTRTIVWVGIVILTLTTCKKDDNTPDPDKIVIAENVRVLDSQTWNDNFISMDSSDYTLTFTDNIKNLIKPGDIIVTSVGEGLLRKAKSVDSSTVGKFLVQTEATYLTDAINQGVVEYNQPLTLGMIDNIQYHYKGIKLVNNSKSPNQLKFGWDINTVLYDYDKDPATTADQIRIEGTLNCDWRFATRIDICWFAQLKEVKFGFESSENLDLTLIAGLQYSFEKSYTLATVNFTPITITVGVVPVVFTPQLKIVVGINGYANASITSGIEQSLSFNAGIRYLKDQGWSPYKDFSKSFTFNPPQLNLNAGAEAYIKPELSVKVYGLAGPYANLKLYSRLDADLLQSPWWTLYGGLQMNAGAKVDILNKFVLEYTISDLLKYETILAQATTPSPTPPTVTTNTVTSVSTTTATCGGNVTAEGSTTVTAKGICWSTSQSPTTSGSITSDGTGTGAFTSNMTNLSPNTTYYVRAYAINSVGTSYGAQVSFKTNQVLSAPIVATNTPTSITMTTATVGGNVSSDGNAAVTERGIYWGTNTNAATTGTKVIVGSGKGSFNIIINSLTASTQYYVIAFAKNSVGETLGTELSFNTNASGQTGNMSDIDGNTYNTVTIGTQEWMAENLKTTKYNDGSAIPNVTDNPAWAALTTGAYCWYNNDIGKKAYYGALYNYYAVVDSRNLCPSGWHIPTDAEFTTLTTYLGGENVAGGKLKANTLWTSPNTGATNESGFSAFPSGYRGYSGTFVNINDHGLWWSSTKYSSSNVWYRVLRYNYSNVNRSRDNERNAFSVRCLKD
jgi:uncharacterized protein (TIGR02145 family)